MLDMNEGEFGAGLQSTVTTATRGRCSAVQAFLSNFRIFREDMEVSEKGELSRPDGSLWHVPIGALRPGLVRTRHLNASGKSIADGERRVRGVHRI